MGYYVKMQELLETGHRLVGQTEEWKKQLEAVRSCVQDFIRDPGCSGGAAESMKAYMKEVHLTLLDWMLANIASYRSSLILYVNGYREIEPDPGAKISQDVLEEELEFLIREKAAYEQTAEELRQVYRELRGVMDIGADTCDGLPDQYDAAIRYVEKVRCDVGEYEEQHSHDLESFHEMNGYIKGMIERHMGGDARGLTSYRAGSLAGLPEYERADALYSGNRTYVESAVEQVKVGRFHMESCAGGRSREKAGAGILGGNLPGSGVVAAKGVALGGKAEKEAGLNAGIFRQMDELRGQVGGKIGMAGKAVKGVEQDVLTGIDFNSGKRDICYTCYDITLKSMLNIQLELGAVKSINKDWILANENEICEYLNPDNYSDDVYMYQFLDLSASAEISQKDMADFLEGKGILSGKENVFLSAAKKYSVSEVYLAAHSALETGNGTSELANGVVVNGRKVYNMYGIGAVDGTAIDSGAQYAYKMGWDTPEKAIEGGAKWISENYVNDEIYQQNTLYEMRWNPNLPGTHQYATDIAWAIKQAPNIKKMYDNFPNAKLTFDIPVYQPE